MKVPRRMRFPRSTELDNIPDGKGKKLKMHLKGDGCAKAVEIAKAFWERRR